MDIEPEAPEWSNADEVLKFLDDHKGARFEVGEYLELPDIEQVYTVIAARPFWRQSRFYLFLDLETVCAVEDCENKFVVSLDVNRWRSNRYVTRCCSDHTYKFHTPMPLAWKTIEERMDILEARALERERRSYREQAVTKAKEEARYGVAQLAVIEAQKVVEMLGPQKDDEMLIRVASNRLPRTGVKRDTRRQQVMRAISVLRTRDLL